jgi:hypothetical protein
MLEAQEYEAMYNPPIDGCTTSKTTENTQTKISNMSVGSKTGNWARNHGPRHFNQRNREPTLA